jgi:hypothetical protein
MKAPLTLKDVIGEKLTQERLTLRQGINTSLSVFFHLRGGGPMERDAEDPPPAETWDYWDILNRWAEQCLAWCRVFGLL